METDKIFKEIVCDSCSSDKRKIVIKINDFNVVECINCGLRYVNPQPTEEFFKMYYSEKYYDGSYDDGYKDYLGDEGEFSNEWNERIDELEKLCEINNLERKVLEIGCGPGLFLKLIAERGWKSTGVEYSDWAAKYAKNDLGLEVTSGNIFDLNAESNSFDFVVMWDTIEHLRNPRETLSEIHRILKPKGILQLTTGQVADLHEILSPGYSMWYVPPAHLFFYSNRSMKYLLESIGFINVKINTDKLSIKSYIYLMVTKILYYLKQYDNKKRAERGSLMKATAIKC
jgi:2-polyprenyl-3-methyl-5-hydroxy-6-metoxy-1,4-benzoquinol methylase